MPVDNSSPFSDPQSWDTIVLGQITSPGLAILTGFKRQFTWDKKVGKGTKGGTSTLTGLPPVSGSIKFIFWTQQHWDDWFLFRPLFKHDPTKKAVTAVDIYHPALKTIDISSVVCEDIGIPEIEGNIGEGKYSITVQLLEYAPASKTSALGTPTGSTTGKSQAGGNTDDPIAVAQQKEIANLLAAAGDPNPHQDLNH